MFDKLEELVAKLEDIMKQLSDPNVVNDQERFKKLMKEQSDLTPVVEKYKEYKAAKQNEEESLLILDEESDEEMKELAKEELAESKKAIERCENELKILLLPKDANDDKNVVVEIRAGVGGEEAALFAYELYRMYQHYAEKKRWKSELISIDDTGIGGVRRTSRSSLELLPLRALSRLLRALLPALTGLVLETLLGTLAGLSLLCLGTLHGPYNAAHHRSRGFRRSAGSFRRFRRLSRFFSRRCRLGCFLFYTCRTII